MSQKALQLNFSLICSMLYILPYFPLDDVKLNWVKFLAAKSNKTTLANYFFSLDCCKEETEGKDNFKGRYTFPETIADTSYTTDCKYNHDGNRAQFSRQCVANMDIGPFWAPVNLENCDAKFSTTNDLLLLNEVDFLARAILKNYVSYH